MSKTYPKIKVKTDTVTKDAEVWVKESWFSGWQGVLFSGHLNGAHPNTCITQREVDRTIARYFERVQKGANAVTVKQLTARRDGDKWIVEPI